MAKDKKGRDKKEYPKLVMSASGKKVLVKTADEEKAVPKPEGQEEKKPAGWGKK